MSKNTQGFSKSLKGTTISGNAGTFDTISANNVQFSATTINSLFQGSLLDGVIIINSQIDNTIIGSDQPNSATFTVLNTIGDVVFTSLDGTRSVYWDAITGIFTVTGDLTVTGCGLFGNIDICKNTIQAINTNGDINLLRKGNGTLFLTGPITNVASTGNYLTNVLNGNVIFNASDYVSLTSNQSTINLDSFSDQTFTTKNGDISLNTETGIGTKIITKIDLFNTLIRVTTSSDSNVKIGDTITISGTNSDPNFNGTFTVTDVLTSQTFNINNPYSYFTTNSNTGLFVKTPSNNINLNAAVYVKIPSDIDLTFGTTTNSVSGNASGLFIGSQGDITFQPNTTSNYIVSIPQNTKFVYGTSSNVYTNFDGNSLNIINNSAINNSVTISTSNLLLNGTDTSFIDPNPLIGNFISGSGDLTDRGIQFRYSEINGNMKLGWFGYKQSTQRFTFLTNASNNDEIITGDLGKFDIGSISVTNITLNEGGTFDVGCGTIANVKLITGCGGTVNINASTNVNISASNRISLISGTDILVPNNIPILFGTNGTTISEVTVGNLSLKASQNIKLLTNTVIISTGNKLSFDGTSVGNQSIYSDLLGNLIISSNKNINLNTTSGNIILPQNNNLTNFASGVLQFGTTSSEIITGGTNGILLLSSSSTGNLNLLSYNAIKITNTIGNINIQPNNGDINLFSTSGNVRILPLSRLIFGINNTNNSIRTNSIGNFMINGPGTSGNLSGVTSGNTVEITNSLNFNINIISSGNINIPNNVNLKLGNSVLVNDTSSNLLLSNTSGNFNNVVNGNINITTSNYNLNDITTNISTNSFVISGSPGSSVTMNTDNVRLKDPILSLSNNNFDLTDKGIEYNYLNSTTGNSLGWFGYKNSTGFFTFYSTAINTNEIITGTLGSIELANLTLSKSITFSTQGNLDMKCGTISNLNTITGCNGTVNINATSNLNANSTNIFLNTQRVLVPFNSILAFGDTNNSISSDNNGNVIITAPSKIILNSDVQINGTTENVFSTVTNIQDPIFSIGGVTGPVLNDNKDRGIEFKWYNNNISFGSLGNKTGFYGYDNSSNRFMFIPDGTNTSEVFTGSFGNVQFNNGYLNNIDINCGTISNVNTITGCNGSILNIVATTSINANTNNFILPFDSNLAFGNTNNNISSNLSGKLIFNASNGVNINSTSSTINFNSNSVNINSNTSGSLPTLNFGSGSSGSTLIQSGGNFNIISSSGNINLTPSGQINGTYGNIIIPTNTSIIFSGTNSNNRISSDSNSLQLYGYENIGINSSTVNIAGNVNIIGTISASIVQSDLNQYILPLGTDQISLITSITPSNVSGSGNTKIITSVSSYLNIGDIITIKNTNSTPLIDGTFTVMSIIDSTTFLINTSPVTTPGNAGSVTSKLTTFQGKDVGIEVERWSSTVGNTIITAGSAGYNKGFYGWKDSLQKFVFYSNATISNSIVTNSILGDVQVNKLETNKISGFQLEGPLQGQSYIISGTNFQIQGGNIDSTPIGQNSASTGRFSNLASTISSTLENVTLTSQLNYSLERFTVDSTLLPSKNPSITVVLSFISVLGAGFTGTGNMPVGIYDGQLKILVASSINTNCKYELSFTPGTLMSPNPINLNSIPTKITLKRRGQSVQLIWDATGMFWLPLTSGVYIS
jgi:hypothetical protein